MKTPGSTPFEITETSCEADATFIRDSLIGYNTATVPVMLDYPLEPLTLVAKDTDGVIVGGLVGRMYLAALFIEFLWVDERVRTLGLGSLLLRRGEDIARKKGCRMMNLDTFSFQAPEFYKKHGFEVFGILDGYADGICRYYLKKILD